MDHNDSQRLLPVSKETRLSAEKVGSWERHPGLQLDRFISWPDGSEADRGREGRRGNGSEEQGQKTQRWNLQRVCQASGSPPLLEELCERRTEALASLGARTIHATTTGPLTLHLARASALENAGICLHPIYGFVHLPGSGLKGMARAYAETVWAPSQYQGLDAACPENAEEEAKAIEAWGKIARIFGWSRGSEDRKLWRPASLRCPDESQAGAVVFHDAWPERWPRLHVDIVNNHHSKYYQGRGDEDPPGDWENPIPVYFLAIGEGETFSLPLSLRLGETAQGLLALACEWLAGALTYEGAGAKTNAGYGSFRVEGVDVAPLPKETRASAEFTVELVTPAFLAGAGQQIEDCELRPATLRGLLRWWWRTMHAGHVSVATLRRLEALLWGNTEAGGAIRVGVEPLSRQLPVLFDKDSFRNALQRRSNRIATQGLYYASYGMDAKSGGLRKQRHYLPAGATWLVRLTARARGNSARPENAPVELTPRLVLKEAENALALLCTFGAVGSRSRKGFGSLCTVKREDVPDLERLMAEARAFREHLGISERPEGSSSAETPVLELMLALGRRVGLDQGFVEVATPLQDPWHLLDCIGASVHAFAQADPQTGHGKHCEAKAALGLPRQIHGPKNKPLGPQRNWKPPRCLRAPHGDRHASPIFYHVYPQPNGTLAIRAAAFPAPSLPDPATSVRILTGLLRHLDDDLYDRCERYRPSYAPRGRGASAPGPTQPRFQATSPGLPSSGDRVRGTIVEDPKGRERPHAKLQGTELVGIILPQGQELPAWKVGDVVDLEVNSVGAGGKQIAFRVPTPPGQGHKKKRGGPHRGRR